VAVDPQEVRHNAPHPGQQRNGEVLTDRLAELDRDARATVLQPRPLRADSVLQRQQDQS